MAKNKKKFSKLSEIIDILSIFALMFFIITTGVNLLPLFDDFMSYPMIILYIFSMILGMFAPLFIYGECQKNKEEL